MTIKTCGNIIKIRETYKNNNNKNNKIFLEVSKVNCKELTWQRNYA